MTFNIVDRRTNNYDVGVDAVYEPSCRDNNLAGELKAEEYDPWSVKQLYNTTVHDAVQYAESFDGPVTIFLYDAGTKPVG